MMKELEQAKKIFLTDVDDETLAENQEQIRAWESSLQQNKAYERWKAHDLTVELNKRVKTSYRDFAMVLATNRSLTEEQRTSIYAKQDACLFILGLTDQDAENAIASVLREIRQTINATS
jgi:hypothetical protein